MATESQLPDTPKSSTPYDVGARSPVNVEANKPRSNLTFGLDWRQFIRLLKGVNRQVNFLPVNFMVSGTPVLVLPQEIRSYFYIANLSTVDTLYIGFGVIPTASTGLPIYPYGYYEPLCVPTNDIFIMSSGTNTAGLILRAK